jgi:hypothetical protein
MENLLASTLKKKIGLHVFCLFNKGRQNKCYTDHTNQLRPPKEGDKSSPNKHNARGSTIADSLA